MYRYEKLDVSNVMFEDIIQTQLSNNSIIRQHFIGSRRNLYSSNHLIATTMQTQSFPLMIGNITQKQFTSFLGTFNKNLYLQIKKNPELMLLHIDFDQPSRGKNISVWEKMPEGQYLYNLDLNSAYWQVAHKLGYISTKLFDNYVNSDEYKMAKRLCVSFLSRKNEMLYYYKDDTFTIKCDTSVLRRIYENIRYYLYNVVAQAVKMCSEWIEYNIDGITVKNTEVDIVQKFFKEEGFLFKIKECRKLNEFEYVYGNSIRRFKNR